MLKIFSRKLPVFHVDLVLSYMRPSVCLQTFSTDMTDEPPSQDQPTIPSYQPKQGESIQIQKARVLYQCRKRGMLENGILLSCFAERFLKNMTVVQLAKFDILINKPTNDWDIYHWISGKAPVPTEYQSEVMEMLQEFVQNKDKEVRLQQPDLSPVT